MNRKIPQEAFDFYFSLGVSRTYTAVAKKYDVSKQAVVRHAVKEGWQDRVTKIEAQAREKSDQRIAESVEEMRARHIRTLQAIQAKAIETLKRMPLEAAMEAIRALDLAMRQECKLREELPASGLESVEAIIKREYALLMVGDEEEGDGRQQAAQ